MSPEQQGWIGVDLDATLAEHQGGIASIGAPIPLMVARVKKWLAEGRRVKICTARMGPRLPDDPPEFHLHQRRMIENWCLEHLGRVLEVTATKDLFMIELWDDRAIGVVPNTGRRTDGFP